MKIDIKYALPQQVIAEILKEGEHTLKFLKADNTERVMVATLNGDIIEESLGTTQEELSEEQILEKRSNKNMAVFDLEKKAFRSFSLERLYSVDGKHPLELVTAYLKEKVLFGEASDE
tara:strand:+ start:690 stop:1043 length:354 start_codon:yes stop_codon:yes gene_type:complete